MWGLWISWFLYRRHWGKGRWEAGAVSGIRRAWHFPWILLLSKPSCHPLFPTACHPSAAICFGSLTLPQALLYFFSTFQGPPEVVSSLSLEHFLDFILGVKPFFQLGWPNEWRCVGRNVGERVWGWALAEGPAGPAGPVHVWDLHYGAWLKQDVGPAWGVTETKVGEGLPFRKFFFVLIVSKSKSPALVWSTSLIFLVSYCSREQEAGPGLSVSYKIS